MKRDCKKNALQRAQSYCVVIRTLMAMDAAMFDSMLLRNAMQQLQKMYCSICSCKKKKKKITSSTYPCPASSSKEMYFMRVPHHLHGPKFISEVRVLLKNATTWLVQ